MTTTPEPVEPVDDGRQRHREMRRPPHEPAPARRPDTSRAGLAPDEVPVRLDRQGPVEAVRPVSVEAAQGWDERLWTRL